MTFTMDTIEAIYTVLASAFACYTLLHLWRQVVGNDWNP